MNILMLMAGADASFREAGHHYPKNLVEIDGLPLIQRVIEGLSSVRQSSRLICCVREEEDRTNHTGDVIRLLDRDAVVVRVPTQTSGAACTALLAIELIDDQEPLLVANGDQILTRDPADAIHDFRERGLDGGIIVFEAVHPRWSYVRTDQSGFVVEAAEKRPISKLATAGMYYFARGADFVQAAMSMIKKDAHVNGAFYVCPSYNELILRGAKIGVFRVPRESYVSLATPENVRAYEAALMARSPK